MECKIETAVWQMRIRRCEWWVCYLTMCLTTVCELLLILMIY